MDSTPLAPGPVLCFDGWRKSWDLGDVDVHHTCFSPQTQHTKALLLSLMSLYPGSASLLPAAAILIVGYSSNPVLNRCASYIWHIEGR